MANEIATAKIVPIIIVHAITAGGLRDEYEPDHRRVWSPLEMTSHSYQRIQLYPHVGLSSDEPRFEALQPALVRPGEPFGIIYKELIEELKHNLSYAPTPIQPVFAFVYDWRQDNRRTIHQLKAFVEDVVARCRLLPHDSSKLAGQPVCDCADLVAHSMGGLVVAGCIAKFAPAWPRQFIRRVVTLGTPYRGACAAILKLATGQGAWPVRNPPERERTMARITPSVYQLLPSFAGALTRREGSGPDSILPEGAIWDAATFQASIRRTLAEHIGEVAADDTLRRGTPAARKECDRIAAQLLDELLAGARDFRALTDSAKPSMLRPDGGWLALVGAGEKTLIQARVQLPSPGSADPRFDFAKDHYSADSWDGATFDTGDETVPLRGATPPWKDAWKNTVVVKRQDMSWFSEFGDRALNGPLGLHGMLPNVGLCQRWIINFLRPEWASSRKLGQHGKLWGRALPGATQAEAENAWKQLINGIRLERPE